jgi:hypothetical protein
LFVTISLFLFFKGEIFMVLNFETLFTTKQRTAYFFGFDLWHSERI